MLKKFLSMSFLVVLMTGMFVGCGGKQQSNTGTSSGSASATGEKTLAPATIKFWFPSEGEVNDKYFADAVQAFQGKYPQIKVDITKLPSANADVDVKLNAAALSGDYPDVFSSYLIFIATHGSRGEFADLKSYMDKWEDKGDIVESAVNMGVYKGQQLGIGFYPAPEILTYRTDYFTEAGLDPAKPPKTWNELRDYAYKLVKKDASGKVIRAGFDVPALGYETFFEPFMRQAGSPVFDEKNEKPSFTDKAASDALTFITSMKDQSIPFDYGKREDFPIMKGNAAMGYLNVSQIAKVLSADPTMKDKLAFAPVLENKTKSDWCGYRLFTMGADSKYKDQSWEFIKFLMSKEEMMKRAKDINIPVVRKSIEKDYIALNPKINTAITDYVKYGKGSDLLSWVSVGNKYTRTAYEEVYTGKKTAEQALKDADTILNTELQGLFKK